MESVFKRRLFFDIDNVLFPATSFPMLARKNALTKMIKLGLNVSYRKLELMLEEIIKEKGSNYPHHFDMLLRKLKVKGPEKSKFIAGAIGAYHDTKISIRPYPDVPPALRILMKKYRLYCASEGLTLKQWDKLIRMNLTMFFDQIFVSQDLKIPKSREFYVKIAELLNTKNSECVMIGDREDKDVIPAKKAGWSTIRVRRKGAKYSKGKTTADAEICSFSELVQILEKDSIIPK